jgi:hypothetical protein
VVSFLASDGASAVNGIELFVTEDIKLGGTELEVPPPLCLRAVALGVGKGWQPGLVGIASDAAFCGWCALDQARRGGVFVGAVTLGQV